MENLEVVKISSGNADASGDATNTSAGVVHGKIEKIYVAYDASSAAGTDVTIATTSTPAETIFSLTDTNTSAMYYPRHELHTPVGGVFYFNDDGDEEVPGVFFINDVVTLTVAQQTEGKGVTVYIYYYR